MVVYDARLVPDLPGRVRACILDLDDHEPYLDGRPPDDGMGSLRSSRTVALLEHGADVVAVDRGELVHGP